MSQHPLDSKLIETIEDIQNHIPYLSKHEKIRVEKWLAKFYHITTNPVWKKNRNNYAYLLLKMLDLGKLEEPFNKLPPDGALPKLDSTKLSLISKTHSAKTMKFMEISNCATPTSKGPSEVEELKKEVERYKLREKQLKSELLASARIINHQDKLIQELRIELEQNKLGSPKDFLEFKDVLDSETDRFYNESLDLDSGGESPSIGDIESPFKENKLELEGTFNPPNFNPFL